nr:MAG TPA: hypothetical protein [Bacteriophage sp.]
MIYILYKDFLINYMFCCGVVAVMVTAFYILICILN